VALGGGTISHKHLKNGQGGGANKKKNESVGRKRSTRRKRSKSRRAKTREGTMAWGARNWRSVPASKGAWQTGVRKTEKPKKSQGEVEAARPSSRTGRKKVVEKAGGGKPRKKKIDDSKETTRQPDPQTGQGYTLRNKKLSSIAEGQRGKPNKLQEVDGKEKTKTTKGPPAGRPGGGN